MFTIFAVFFLLLGVCVGSFLNVVVLRYNTGLGMSRERSICFTCGEQIPWQDNVPLLSFMILWGRCRWCKTRISWQYPLVELLAGLIFLGIWLKFAVGVTDVEMFTLPTVVNVFLPVVYYSTLFSILIAILVYDFKHKIIPDLFVYSFSTLALLGIGWTIWTESVSHIVLLNLIAGPLFFTPFFLLWYVSDGRWIGLGDGKLALGIGWMLGLVYGLSAIILAFWVGAVMSVALVLLSKYVRSHPHSFIAHNTPIMTMKSEVPFAPFLILGVVAEFFWMIDVIGLSILM